MLVGYNDNVTFKGKVYHVQTEDSGLKNPVIVTLLYFRGVILASKKTNYSHLIGSKDIKENVRKLMQEQHKAILKELISGKFTEETRKLIGEETAEENGHPEFKKYTPKSIAKKTLDDILLDFLMEREKSK